MAPFQYSMEQTYFILVNTQLSLKAVKLVFLFTVAIIEEIHQNDTYVDSL